MKSKLHLASLACAIAISLVVSGQVAKAQVTYQKIVVGVAYDDFLNVRTGPSARYADVGDLRDGSVVNILGFIPSGKWAIIKWRGKIAYVSAKYLANKTRYSNSFPNRLGRHVVTNIDPNDKDGGLNLRTGPGTNYDVFDTLGLSTRVNVLEISADGKWALIQGPFGIGYVRGKHLVKEN